MIATSQGLRCPRSFYLRSVQLPASLFRLAKPHVFQAHPSPTPLRTSSTMLAAASQLSAVSCRAAGSQRRAGAGASAPLRPAAWRPAAMAPRGGGSSSAARSRGRLLVTAAVKVQKGKQMLCSKTLRAKEGEEAKVEELCRKVSEYSRGRMADRTSGVLAFELSQVNRCAGWCWRGKGEDALLLLAVSWQRRRRRPPLHLPAPPLTRALAARLLAPHQPCRTRRRRACFTSWSSTPARRRWWSTTSGRRSATLPARCGVRKPPS